MTIKFVICERLHDGGNAVENVLHSYKNNCFCFVDGEEGLVDPELILTFDNYKAAMTLVDLAWDFNKTFLGVAIWDDRYPNEITYSYVGAGEEKNNQVKMNRENES